MAKSLGAQVARCSLTVFAKRARETGDVALLPGPCALLETIDQLAATDGLDSAVNQLCRERYPEVVCLEHAVRT